MGTGLTRKLPDAWSPGSLPSEVAASALLAAAAFLAAENGAPVQGMDHGKDSIHAFTQVLPVRIGTDRILVMVHLAAWQAPSAAWDR